MNKIFCSQPTDESRMDEWNRRRTREEERKDKGKELGARGASRNEKGSTRSDSASGLEFKEEEKELGLNWESE